MSTQTQPAPVLAWHRIVGIYASDRCRAGLGASADDLASLVAYHDPHAAEVEQLRAQLRERTQWQCKCGGTDCAGQAENERLRAEVEAFKANNRYMRGHTAGYAEARAEHGEQLKPLFAKVRELERLLIAAEPYVSRSVINLSNEIRAAIDAAREGKGAT